MFVEVLATAPPVIRTRQPAASLPRDTRRTPVTGDSAMLHYAIVFLVIALIAGVLGFGGIAGTAAGIAKILFVIFIILFLVSLVMGRRRV
jgi:uncharacterized membrane protein YtjA (UPF0391 family)